MNRYSELTSLLRSLKLQTMADSVSEVALKAARANLSHEAFLYELVRLEQEQRTQRRIERLRRESGLPRDKTFATLELAGLGPLVRQQVERLRRGEFVAQAVNVVAVGPPGVGKSHLLASVGHTLVTQGVAVLWSSTAQLMQRLLAAKRDLRLPQELARLDRYACLILDDIGYVQHDQDEMEVLFPLLSERYERRSVMLSTNLVFSVRLYPFVPARRHRRARRLDGRATRSGFSPCRVRRATSKKWWPAKAAGARKPACRRRSGVPCYTKRPCARASLALGAGDGQTAL